MYANIRNTSIHRVQFTTCGFMFRIFIAKAKISKLLFNNSSYGNLLTSANQIHVIFLKKLRVINSVFLSGGWDYTSSWKVFKKIRIKWCDVRNENPIATLTFMFYLRNARDDVFRWRVRRYAKFVQNCVELFFSWLVETRIQSV